MSRPLLVFVYGTLKRGGRFHDRYCHGVLSVAEATVRGRLSMLPAGYPVLDVPKGDVLAVGTVDPESDAALLATLTARLTATDGERWQEIEGELMTFGDPAVRLPELDRLEGFVPGETSLYRRVALSVRSRDRLDPVAAWVYVRGDR